MPGYKGTRSAMGNMAKSLARDLQRESIVASRKNDLGITVESGRRLGQELAFADGIDLGREVGASELESSCLLPALRHNRRQQV